VKTKQELQPGDGVDILVARLLSNGIRDGFTTREEWLPGAVRRIDDSTVTVFIYGQGLRDYPINDDRWRPAK
jgi:hypothetical protein